MHGIWKEKHPMYLRFVLLTHPTHPIANPSSLQNVKQVQLESYFGHGLSSSQKNLLRVTSNLSSAAHKVSSLYISFGGGAPAGDIDNDGVDLGAKVEKMTCIIEPVLRLIATVLRNGRKTKLPFEFCTSANFCGGFVQSFPERSSVNGLKGQV